MGRIRHNYIVHFKNPETDAILFCSGKRIQYETFIETDPELVDCVRCQRKLVQAGKLKAVMRR